MAPRRKASDGLLARVNFPLYSMEMLTSRHVLVAGGGGSANTGVASGFEIYELYFNGQRFCAEEIVRHETGANAVMNFAVCSDHRRTYICAGQESHCQVYHAHIRVENVESENTSGKKPPIVRPHENGVRQRVTSGVQDLASENGFITKDELYAIKKRLLFEIRPADLIQTAFGAEEPLQRVIRISLDGKLMATGCSDGYLRVWSFPQIKEQLAVAAHTKEIDDIDFSPDGCDIVSTAKDGRGFIWDAKTLEKKHELQWSTPDDIKFSYKRCRYGTIEGNRKAYRLFIIANPPRVGKQRSYLQQWDAAMGKLRLAVPIDDCLASLAVRDDGRFVAVGTMSGSVSMYISFSLQRVLHVEKAHPMFVTGLQFLPVTNTEEPAISSNAEAAVLSISVDNCVCIHSLQQRRTIPAWIAIIFIVMVIFNVFLFCSYVGL